MPLRQLVAVPVGVGKSSAMAMAMAMACDVTRRKPRTMSIILWRPAPAFWPAPMTLSTAGATLRDYDVVMPRKQPTPVRLDPDVAARLALWASAHRGLSLSSAINQLVDEGLRAEEHPGIVFRPGATGRRAGLVGGPDVWEVVRAVRSARHVEPDLSEDEILQLVSHNTGVSVRLIQAAVRYWATYPDEIDAEIHAAAAAEEQAELAWRRQQDLLCRR